MKITSAANPRIKKIAKLKHRKTRDQTRLTLVDGVREVMRAQEAGAPLVEIYFSPELLSSYGGQTVVDKMASWSVPMTEVSPDVFDKISFGDRREGVVAVCEIRPRTIAQLTLKRDPFLIVIEKIEKPGNLGAILRTCDGAGVDAVLLTDAATDLFNPNVVRASIGAVFSVPIAVSNNKQALEFLKEKNITILAASPAGQETYWTADFKGAAAVVLGSEQEGLSDFWFEAADRKISIPMRGKTDSLNVSNAAAILIYEALRQRR